MANSDFDRPRIKRVLISGEWYRALREMRNMDPKVLKYDLRYDSYEVEYPFRTKLEGSIARLLGEEEDVWEDL